MAFSKKPPAAKPMPQPKAPPVSTDGEMANMLKRVSAEKAPPKQSFPPAGGKGC